MDDRRAHFVTMIGDVCLAAGLAHIPVELLMRDGARVYGTPSPVVADLEHPPLGETGYASRLTIDGVETFLEDVVEFLIRSP